MKVLEKVLAVATMIYINLFSKFNLIYLNVDMNVENYFFKMVYCW